MNQRLSILTAVQRILLGLTILLFSCNQESELKAENAEELITDTLQAEVDTVTLRPAPVFFIIPEELDKQRVWICDGSKTEDVFHVKNDCPNLVSCKGKGTFRNISIHRAIEYFGRYNCDVCSKDLAHIFDENMVR
ncbi:hypothetical protein [Pontibacter arcticus]|uniref:Uncharacterized protein n=1 Tax=Pontibacter arcticus TaxID=2080288 RepID=A0A364REA8_9BACT|nr:hypothetical protein [Pontibacter arcticus]RAU82506.1 hypothetical protein DP923_12055 [Pontibacter arcticus]